MFLYNPKIKKEILDYFTQTDNDSFINYVINNNNINDNNVTNINNFFNYKIENYNFFLYSTNSTFSLASFNLDEKVYLNIIIYFSYNLLMKFICLFI